LVDSTGDDRGTKYLLNAVRDHRHDERDTGPDRRFGQPGALFNAYRKGASRGLA
jgi:hypothetical protein